MDITARYESKIKRLLTKLLDPTYEISNDLYLNTFIAHLSGKYDQDFSQNIQNLPILTEWIIEAVSVWENHTNPSKTASIFILNLVGLLSKSDERFTYFKTFNIYNSLTTLLKIKSPATSPIVKLGFIKMLSSLLEHKLGLDWLISTDNWREILNFSLQSNTIYVIRESSEFIVCLLKKSIDFNEIFCKLVVKNIVGKLNECLVCESFGKEIDEDVLKRRSEPILKLILYIFDNFLSQNVNNYENNDFRVANLFILTFSIENILWNYSNCSKSIDFTSEIDNCLLLTFFIKTASIKSRLIPPDSLRSCGASIIKLLSLKISKHQHLNVLKICFFASQSWNFLSKRIEKPTNETALLKLENHLVPIELLPIIVVTFNHCGKVITDLDIDEIRDEFISKLFKTMSEGVTRIAFQFKDQLIQFPDIFPLAIAALRNILNGRKNFRRSRAILVFQGCVYSFKDITMFLKESIGVNQEQRENVEMFLKNPSYFINLINCLSVLINENNITWSESVETICVLNVTIDFLNLPIPTWNYRVKIEALKLLNLSISKYMSPNLTLLLDNTQDSCLNQLGPLLLNNLSDLNWEIRDSALEVLKTILDFSYSKFPGFRDLIKTSNLLDFVIKLVLNDSESFVRASCWKCLQEIIKINDFWLEIINLKKDLIKTSLIRVKSEPEAIVRVEIAKFIRIIYEYQEFPGDLIDVVYDSMFYAATKDFHWEVKTNSLDFWGKVILNHLEEQGMIDNAFPEITFSREQKKIIRLTDNAIKIRLKKVLKKLELTGCLTVLIRGLNDDCDLEVVRTSIEKVKKFVILLRMYKLIPERKKSFEDLQLQYIQNCNQIPSQSCSLNVAENDQFVTENTNLSISDQIINEIVNTTDLNLLENVSNSLYVEENFEGIEKRNQLISVDDFLKAIDTDLDAILRSKTSWLATLDDFGSLLDDILKDYDTKRCSKVNEMDCY
ncbi:uncharacterized protein [Onthophagus taurus]|uniref:uncharacterized protein n=1 Tax=Onthophagus taurus TaxID=166361 RepID=UPI000C208228|nr:uncharacterized protein LOC111417832 [Onthophagus taurus]